MKSLYLNWIRNVDKSLVMPEVIFSSSKNHSGCYYRPRKGEIYDGDGHPHDARFGVIELSNIWAGYEAGTLAHEWRHHWQWHHGWKLESVWNPPSNVSYKEALIDYFRKYKHERDALRFEYKHADIYEEWEEILYDFLNP